MGIASDACTNELLGEDLCIRHMGGCEKKVKLDYTGLDLISLSDLMGLCDSDGIQTMPWSEILACPSGCNSLSLSSCVQALRAVYHLARMRPDFVTSVVWWAYIRAATKFVYHLSKFAPCARPSQQLAAAVEKQPLRKDFPDAQYR